MELHERTLFVNITQAKLSVHFWQTASEAKLTDGEIVQCLSSMLQSAAKYMVRNERHPNESEKRGDEA